MNDRIPDEELLYPEDDDFRGDGKSGSVGLHTLTELLALQTMKTIMAKDMEQKRFAKEDEPEEELADGHDTDPGID